MTKSMHVSKFVAAPFGFLCAYKQVIFAPPPPGVHKIGIRGIQDTRQIVDGKTNDIENNDKNVGPNP